MAEAVASSKPSFNVVGILPSKFQEILTARSEKREMDKVMKEVYSEMGIKDIKELMKDFNEMTKRQESTASSSSLASNYYEKKEISDFAKRSMNADKRSIRNKLIAVGAATVATLTSIFSPAVAAAFEAVKKAIMATWPWIAIPLTVIPAAIFIKRTLKSKRGNYYDGHAKQGDADKELMDLITKLERVRSQIEAKKQEFLQSKKNMTKKEYTAWMKSEVKKIVASVGSDLDLNLGDDPFGTEFAPEDTQKPSEPVKQEPTKSEPKTDKNEPEKKDTQEGLSL